MDRQREWQLRRRLDLLVDDVGRLRRRVACTDPESSLNHLAARIGGHVEVVVSFFEPTAAELVACTFPADDETVREALRIVDDRHRSLSYRIGGGAA